MNKFFVTILALALCGETIAQDYTVADFECDQTDLTAQQRNIKDDNGKPCSLLRVLLVDNGAKFSGSYTGDIEKFQNEYWLWMQDGSESVAIRTSSSSTLSVKFADYGIKKLEGKLVYVLTVMSSGNIERKENLVSFKVEPFGAEITIDGEKHEVASGYLTLLLPYGKHEYSVSAKGYKTKNGKITVSGKQSLTSVELVSTNASLSISANSYSAEIFVDSEAMGYGNWKGEVSPGEHSVEVRDKGYTTGVQKIVIKEEETKEISLTPETPITGTLRVLGIPYDATLYVDGKKASNSTNYNQNLLVGDHYIDISCDGYKSMTYSFEVKKDQSHTINVALERGDGWQFDVKGVEFEMIYVEGGTFLMGYTGIVTPQILSRYHNNVTLDSYYIGQNVVTQGLWKAVYGTPNKRIYEKKEDHEKYGLSFPENRSVGDGEPLFEFSWLDINLLIEKLNALTGKTFRLPTEAEWEFAAKGGNKSKGYKYSGATTEEESKGIPNELGIYNMTSGFREICSDFFSKDLGEFPKYNPQGPSKETLEGKLKIVTRGWTVLDRGSEEIPDINTIYVDPVMREYLNLRLALDNTTTTSKSTHIESKHQPASSGDYTKEEEVSPEYPGGKDKLNNYLSENVKYPTTARKKNIRGEVIVTFIVESDGSISNVEVEGIDSTTFGDEAKRVIGNMPQWLPGKDKSDNAIPVKTAIFMGFGMSDNGSFIATSLTSGHNRNLYIFNGNLFMESGDKYTGDNGFYKETPIYHIWTSSLNSDKKGEKAKVSSITPWRSSLRNYSQSIKKGSVRTLPTTRKGNKR